MIRLFVDAPLSEGMAVAPSKEQAHYLLNVMRQQAGAEVALFNGRDGEWRAEIADVTRKACALRLTGQARPFTPPPDVELIVALVKRARLETIVEKAAELGAARVRLAITRRTNADHTRIERLRAIAVEASEQTGRLDVPEIIEPEKLDRVLEGWDSARRLMFCDEGGDARPVLDLDQSGPWAILIGPEGGFAPEERDRLRGESFVTPVSLGPRILRADTAAIAAMSLWQARLGDWREQTS
ncbi:MAG: 16S rRNA (uracil(1498)-N(3))-methyltransferase [Caulobacteraceae bacterium]